MNDESMMHKPLLITKLGYAGFHALNWSWLFNKYLSLKMVILSSLPLNYSGFFWLHRFLHRHAYFAPSLTLYFLIYCSFPLSRYSFSAIKVSSKSWLSQRCFSDITNGNYCLSPSSYILISLSFNLCICACVSCGNISFDTTCFVICRFLE